MKREKKGKVTLEKWKNAVDKKEKWSVRKAKGETEQEKKSAVLEAQSNLDSEEETVPEDAMIFCDSAVKIYMSDGLKVMALQGLDLEVKTGEMTAIIGKSGSGKSTLLNMIGGLETPTAGRLFINGKDLSTYSEKEMTKYRRSTVGFVWQNSARNLLPYITAVENVMSPMIFAGEKKSEKQRRKRAMELLKAVGMENHADKFPAQLSGGEQQRVAIAVALANDPVILLADEPTGAVDSKTSNQIFNLFQKLNRELSLTILIVTHDISLANKVDRVVMIADGKISTEKIRTDALQKHGFDDSEPADKNESHQEFSVLDKAHRVQLTDEVLAQAGITSNKVRVEVVDGKVVISKE